MNIPTTFPTDVKTKLQALETATQKNNASTEALKKQLTNDDYRNIMTVVDIENAKYSTKTTAVNTDAPVVEKSFVSKYKTYIIVVSIVVLSVIGYFIVKRK